MTSTLTDLDELLADVGDRIRAERWARNWTQPELGERSGLGYRTISAVEVAGTGLSLVTLAAICRGLGMSMSDLLSDEWAMPADARQEKELTPRQIQVLREAASGDSLFQVAARVGTTAQQAGARLSESYRLLGVDRLPRGERRAAAVRVAETRGLLTLVDAA